MDLEANATAVPADGMYYDDMHRGLRFEQPPGVTIDAGMVALYTALSGDSLALTLDGPLCEAVTSSPDLLVNPALVMHVSIGASTVATRNVIGNLFYRNVIQHQPVFQGTTLRTTTGVLAMSDARPKPETRPRGKVLLGMQTTTADGTTVLDYERCPLIPCRGDVAPGHADVIGAASGDLDLGDYAASVPDWDLAPLGVHDQWEAGVTRDDVQRDHVDMAAALARMTHNQAAVHRDSDASPYPGRLVYGGHTVALAQASLNRVLGGLATVIGWHACSHTAPVFDNDILSSHHTLVEQREIGGATLRAVHVEVRAHRPGEDPISVLDWTPIVLTT